MTTPHSPTADMSPEARRALLAQLLREKAKATKASFPLSYGQKALYFIHQLAPESAAYNVSFAARVLSPIDQAALQRVFQVLIDRHAALRTTFAQGDDRPIQLVAGAADLDFNVVSLAGCDEHELLHAVENAQEQAFDLEHGPLLRVALFSRSASDHVLLMTVHHIVFDGWSMGVLLDELAKLYAAEMSGVPANLPPVPKQYSEYVAWQQAILSGPQGEQLSAFWSQQLAGTLPVLDLPIDYPRPAFQRMHGGAESFELSDKLAQGLRTLAKAEHATLYALVLAAFYVLLHRITGQEDLIIGSPMAGRSQPEFQQTVGYLVSPVPLRVGLTAEQPFTQVLARVRQTVHDALAHENYPFALMVEQLQPRREPGRTPIMEAIFIQQKVQMLGKIAESMVRRDAAPSQATPAALKLQPYHINQENGQFDLSLLLIETDDQLRGSFKYNSDLFAPATIQRMAGHFQTLLAGIVANPDCAIGSLPLLTTDEYSLLTNTWNATSVEFARDRCLHELIAAQAAHSPHAIAATFGDQQISYRELDQRANQLAQHLRTLGIEPDVLVGVYLERSLEMLVALLGVLKAGGAYVPLDPGFPRERLAMMLEDAAAPVVITQATLANQAPAHSGILLLIDTDWPTIATQPATPPETGVQSEHLAYVIFTSGSTGRPKGVQIPHRAVVNFLNAMRVQPGLTSNDILVAVTTLSFDIAVLELYLPLTIGAQVVLANRETTSDGAALQRLLSESKATVMQATPVTWKLLLDAGWQPTGPFKALCGGEAFPPELAQALLATGVELWNMYGPTETTVWSSVYPVTAVDGPLPIGRPIDNTQLYVLNSLLQPQPAGVVGELYIGGAGLAHGYHKRPELTAERFVRDPFSTHPQARMYRSGDLARLRPNGIAEVLGRTDHQVKIRGFRIELGEIEAALLQNPAVAEAVVVAREDQRGQTRLLAYLVPSGDQKPQAGALRLQLRATLPDYMIPAGFMLLEQLPRSPNGKLDRRALPAPEPTRARGDDGYVAPTTPTELIVAIVWREVLGLDRVSAYDNFFDLGGHSLIAVEALARLERQLGPKLNPAFIRAQTLGQLAAAYDEALHQPAPAGLPAETQAPAQVGIAGKLFGALRRVIPAGEKSR